MKVTELLLIEKWQPKLKQFLRVMKCTIVLLLLGCMHVYADGFSQSKISLRLQQTDLKKALYLIEKQSNVRFLYNQEVVKSVGKVSVEADNQALAKVLDELLEGTGVTYKILEDDLVVLNLSGEFVDKADVVVTGTVADSAGIPLPGVSVTVKGTKQGTSTDAGGKYSISVAEGATLVFSAIGYTTTQELVSGRTTINPIMFTAVSSLDNIVVVGYGTQKKRDLTGSITSVSGEEVSRQPNTNPMSSLQGKVAGLTVANSGRAGSSPTVRIRGINSTNSASPVYVVDGILQDDIDYLNPNDIESIDILRDPSSIAIYGLRGANGVIAITTKKASRGKTRISLQSSLGVQTVQNKIELVDAAGFRKLYDAQLANLNAAPFDYTNYTANTNWQDLVLRDAMININNLTISNNGEKSSTLLNIGYTNQEGVLKNDRFQRYLVRLNEEIRITKNIKVGGEVTGYHYVFDPPAASITNALWAAPIAPIKTDTGTYYSMPSFQRAQVGNPAANIARNDRNSVNKGYRVIGSLFAEVKFLKNFTWKSVVYTDLGFINTRSLNRLPFRFVNLGEGAATTNTTFDNAARTTVTQSSNELKKFQQDHTLTFDKRIDNHSITVLAGFTTLYNQTSNISGNRRDTGINIIDDPNYWYLGVANANNPTNVGGGGSENSIVGAFGRISYSFNNKYLLNATLRRDGSSKFAPENRWGTFGSIGAGWVVSDEGFFANVKKIDFFKIRGAWGVTGNANGFRDNLWQPGISNSSTAVFGDNVYSSIQAEYIPDPRLHWEKVNGLDVGFDLRAFNSRFNAEVTYYNRTTTDLLTAVTIPNETRSYFTNLGKITNKGIEVSMGWNDKLPNGLSYGISGNFSYNKNVVNAIGDRLNFQLTGNGGVNLTTTGYSVGYFYGYRQVGIYQSTADLLKQPALATSLPGDIAYEDINNDGVINSADRTYLGTPFPPYNFGGSISLGYKGFDFMIDGQGVAGNKIYTQRRTANFAVLNYEANRLNAWTGPASTNIEPILDNTRANNFLFSSYYLEPGDYFRVRNIQLGYTISNTKNFLGISNARIYVSGQNVFSWSQVTGYSPEPQISSILGGGADNGSYPVPSTYSVGINVTF